MLRIVNDRVLNGRQLPPVETLVFLSFSTSSNLLMIKIKSTLF